MNRHTYGVILAGGIGSRFWPLSTLEKPKQFLDFTGDGKSFLRMAYDRFEGIVPKENIIIVSQVRYKDEVLAHIPELSEENLLLEPYGRNTAPSLAYATFSILKRDPDAVMVLCPSDHIISDMDKFRETISSAIGFASENRALVTLGIVPDRPDTNFGYIQVVGGAGQYGENRPLKVKTFTEKPDAELADVFIKSGEFLWNAGIFVWKAEVIMDELNRYAPLITSLFRGWEGALGTPFEREFIEKTYMNIEGISIDYAIMEKTELDWVIPASFGWADIGNWDSLYGYLAKKDDQGNAIKAAKAIVQKDVKDNVVYTQSGKLVVMSGMENFVVVDTGEVLMICPRDDKKLKELISNIAMPGFEEYR